MNSSKPAEAFAKASGTDRIVLAPFLATNLDKADHVTVGAQLRARTSASTRFAAPRQGEQF